MWQAAQTILESTDYPIDDKQFMTIYYLLRVPIERLIEHYYRAISSGVIIPRDDLKSIFLENLWACILTCQKDPNLSLKKIFLHRIKLRDSDLYRKNQSIAACDSLDTDRQETINTTSLAEKLSDHLALVDKITLKKILSDFNRHYPQEGALISLLIAGWTPAEVAQIAYHDSNYSALSRQKICRLRHLFRQFYKQYQ
ncbi:hypothetical protein GKC32_06995 [Lactobacillus curvatus]|nr:hypothetical protein [Latilactobacillus curvatus]MSE24216.1 hypothetical protein [Latilactobacillus curvatus]